MLYRDVKVVQYVIPRCIVLYRDYIVLLRFTHRFHKACPFAPWATGIMHSILTGLLGLSGRLHFHTRAYKWNLAKYSCCANFDSNYFIKSQFCTWHESWAVVPCAKIVPWLWSSFLTFWVTGGCFTNVSRAPRNNIHAENFKLKICACAQSHALGTRTKFQLKIITRGTILAI